MRFNFLRNLTAGLTLTAFSLLGTTSIAEAQTFGQQRIQQGDVIPVAVPFGGGRHNLVVIQQQSDEKQCWQERGQNPVSVELRLLDFDFTGICGRATDSNGYSIRLGDRDLAWTYSLRLERRNQDIVLVGKPVKRGRSEIVIGRTNGLAPGPKKVQLDPGWAITKRTYENKVLGHYYLASSETTATMPPDPSSPPQTEPSSPSEQETAQGKTQLHDFVNLLCANFSGLPGCESQSSN